jgi:hypothetical protein
VYTTPSGCVVARVTGTATAYQGRDRRIDEQEPQGRDRRIDEQEPQGRDRRIDEEDPQDRRAAR